MAQPASLGQLGYPDPRDVTGALPGTCEEGGRGQSYEYLPADSHTGVHGHLRYFISTPVILTRNSQSCGQGPVHRAVPEGSIGWALGEFMCRIPWTETRSPRAGRTACCAVFLCLHSSSSMPRRAAA